MDKRLLIYKKMRLDLLKEESKSKEDNQNAKMQQLNTRITKLEEVKQEKSLKEEQDREEQKKK